MSEKGNLSFFKKIWTGVEIIEEDEFSNLYKVKKTDSDEYAFVKSVILKSDKTNPEAWQALDELSKKYAEKCKELKKSATIDGYEVLRNKKKHRITINIRCSQDDEELFKMIEETFKNDVTNDSVETISENELESEADNKEDNIEKVANMDEQPEEKQDESIENRGTQNMEEQPPVQVINKTSVVYKESSIGKSVFSSEKFTWLLILVTIIILMIFYYKGRTLGFIY